MNWDLQHWLRPGLLQLDQLPPLSLYVHLPWCLKKCPYCDFNSHEWRALAHPQRQATDVPGAQAGAQALPEDAYIAALVADLQRSLPLVWGRAVHSIFIGGGTPSLFSPAAIERLLGQVRALLPVLPDAEVTLEANPGTFEKDRFRAYAAAGVTRLSLGVQSFSDEHLRALGRVHDAQQAHAAAEEAAAAFATFNLDLMYALPAQSQAQLVQDLACAMRYAPPHLSVYHLTLEPNTYFAKYPPPHLPDDDLAYAMLDHISAVTAQAGMQRYEVSAYARSGHRSVHNRNYWQFGDYLGLGAGAHSKLSFAHRIMRMVRHREPALYMQQAMAHEPVAQCEEVARAQLPFEFMLNALRLREGFSLKLFVQRTGLPLSALEPGLQQGLQQGWLECAQDHLRPSEKGFDFLSNLQELFLVG